MTPRVLIVDDEAALRRTLERALRAMGYDVVTVGDAQLAYEALDGMDVDLVLLDLHLPQMSGDTFFVALASRWPHLASRIVLMTGDTYAETGHWPRDLKLCPLLLKPFTLDMLRGTVAAALERAGSTGRRAGNGSA
ncbi:MAG TPA: response regulator [Gemmatimonadales bacterium]|jgi:two-component system response regulator MprA|nr:response regulator [Gemmatimonadales bacterium]